MKLPKLAGFQIIPVIYCAFIVNLKIMILEIMIYIQVSNLAGILQWIFCSQTNSSGTFDHLPSINVVGIHYEMNVIS